MRLILAVLILAGCILAYPQRSRGLMRLGSKLGLRYSAGDILSLWETYGSCYLMQFGHSPRIVHVLSGRLQQVPVTVFEYHLEAGSGLLRRTASHSVILVTCRERLPFVVIRRCDDFEPVGRFHGFRQVVLEQPGCDSVYVYSDDTERAKAYLRKEFLEVLCQWPEANCEFYEQGILFYSSTLLDMNVLDQWIRQAMKAADCLGEKNEDGLL